MSASQSRKRSHSQTGPSPHALPAREPGLTRPEAKEPPSTSASPALKRRKVQTTGIPHALPSHPSQTSSQLAMPSAYDMPPYYSSSGPAPTIGLPKSQTASVLASPTRQMQPPGMATHNLLLSPSRRLQTPLLSRPRLGGTGLGTGLGSGLEAPDLHPSPVPSIGARPPSHTTEEDPFTSNSPTRSTSSRKPKTKGSLTASTTLPNIHQLHSSPGKKQTTTGNVLAAPSAPAASLRGRIVVELSPRKNKPPPSSTASPLASPLASPFASPLASPQVSPLKPFRGGSPLKNPLLASPHPTLGILTPSRNGIQGGLATPDQQNQSGKKSKAVDSFDESDFRDMPPEAKEPRSATRATPRSSGKKAGKVVARAPTIKDREGLKRQTAASPKESPTTGRVKAPSVDEEDESDTEPVLPRSGPGSRGGRGRGRGGQGRGRGGTRGRGQGRGRGRGGRGGSRATGDRGDTTEGEEDEGSESGTESPSKTGKLQGPVLPRPDFRKLVIAEDRDEYEEEICQICRGPESEPPNEIIFCDGCDLGYHQICHQVPVVPEDEWMCKNCLQEDVAPSPSKADVAKKNTSRTEAKTKANEDSDDDDPSSQLQVESLRTQAPDTTRSFSPMARHPSASVSVSVSTGSSREVPAIENLDTHLNGMKRVLLDRCTGQRRAKLIGHQDAYEKVHQVVEQTIISGEGNSMLVIGARGIGKTTLVEGVLSAMEGDHAGEFHVVRLNGHIHTDDKLALKDIWRQIGQSMHVEEEVLHRTSYADTMASLLALLSHPTEMGLSEGGEAVTSNAIVFVIDEFDMFAFHARQTLLYNLFDIAQSRKAPIAVLGCTTRLDVVEMLEKRVKSRFSHRYVFLTPPMNLVDYWAICRQGLIVDAQDAVVAGLDPLVDGYDAFRQFWEDQVQALFEKSAACQRVLKHHFYAGKSVPGFWAECVLPLAMLTAEQPFLEITPSPSISLSAVTQQLPEASASTDAASYAFPQTQSRLALPSLAAPPSKLHLLRELADLDLALLIAAARLDIIAHTDTVNFAMAYDEYVSLMGRQRLQNASAGLMALGGSTRVWGRGVAGISWERLISLGLLLPSGLGGGAALGGMGGSGGLEGKMWRVDVALEEIPAATPLGTVLGRWCREI